MDDYRSWTKVDWANPGLDENSFGQNVVGRKPFGPKGIGRNIYQKRMFIHANCFQHNFCCY